MNQLRSNRLLQTKPTRQPRPKASPNFATAVSDINFFYNGPTASSQLTSVESQVLVQGNGIATAIADASATFRDEPNFSALFTLNGVVGEEGTYNSISRSEAEVIGAFSLKANEKFSFTFSSFGDLQSKEIRNRNSEYAYAGQNTSFVILDITDPNKSRVVDYFSMNGKLDSSRYFGRQRVRKSRNVDIKSQEDSLNIGGNDGVDGITSLVEGGYERSFGRDTRLAVVEVINSYTEVIGDTLIGNLGRGVTYGTIRNDYLYANFRGSRVYASFGDDRLYGSDRKDTLEGSFGNDRLQGRGGDDKLHGGFDDDILQGGRGSDLLVGGDGKDTFVFRRNEFSRKERDVVADFEVGVDRLQFSGWRSRDILQEAKLSDTADGATLRFNQGGEILFKDVKAADIKSSLSGRRGGRAAFQNNLRVRAGARAFNVKYDAIKNAQPVTQSTQALRSRSPRPAAGAAKLDDAALVKGLKLEGDRIQFRADTQNYNLQFVQGSNQPRGTSITYQGSQDLLGSSVRGTVGATTFSNQVFGVER